MDALRRAFNDITKGYTKDNLFGRIIYIKHLNYADQIENDLKRDEFFKEAFDQGLHTNEQKSVLLKEAKLWTDHQEKELINSQKQITSLIEGKSKNMKMPSLVKQYNEMIKKEESEYHAKLMQKRSLLGLTCETYADKQLADYYIYTNLFQDSALSQHFFTLEEFDYLTENEMDTVTETYNRAIDNCSESNIKKLTIQPFFQNYFGLTGDNLGQFFGKPISELTFFQVRLINYGAHFRSIFGTHDVNKFPAAIRSDPDLISDYAEAAKKGKEDMEKQGAYEDESLVVGAKKEDITALGLKSRNVASEIAKSGGSAIDWVKNRT